MRPSGIVLPTAAEVAGGPWERARIVSAPEYVASSHMRVTVLTPFSGTVLTPCDWSRCDRRAIVRVTRWDNETGREEKGRRALCEAHAALVERMVEEAER